MRREIRTVSMSSQMFKNKVSSKTTHSVFRRLTYSTLCLFYKIKHEGLVCWPGVIECCTYWLSTQQYIQFISFHHQPKYQEWFACLRQNQESCVSTQNNPLSVHSNCRCAVFKNPLGLQMSLLSSGGAWLGEQFTSFSPWILPFG